MISWITGWVGKFLGLVPQAILDLVHWGLHALASVINAIFGNVARAWHTFWGAMAVIERACFDFGAAVFGLAVKVLKYWVPRIWAEIKRVVAALWHGIDWVWTHAVKLVSELRATAWHWILDLWHMVLRDVWKPLKDYADHIWALLVKWGFTAWWWITHLPSLAEALVFHLAAAIERHAWELARILGTFLTALVLHNVRRFVLLLETILAAVL